MDYRKTCKVLKTGNTNLKNCNKKTVTIGSLMEEGGKQKSTRGRGSKVEASPSELPAQKSRYRRTCPGLGSPALKKREKKRQRRRGSFNELINLVRMGVIKPPFIYSKYSAWQRGYGFVPLNEKRPNTEAHHIDNEHVIFIDKELHRKFASLDREEHRKCLSVYVDMPP